MQSGHCSAPKTASPPDLAATVVVEPPLEPLLLEPQAASSKCERGNDHDNAHESVARVLHETSPVNVHQDLDTETDAPGPQMT